MIEDITIEEDINNIEAIEEEIEDNYVNDDLYTISSRWADFSFRELISMYVDGDLLKPELQRKYVWWKPEASRFIDSVLLWLPIPSIFLAKTEDNKMLIVDWYQRLMTIHDYVRWTRTEDGRIFRLSNISWRIHEKWKNKAFSELDESEQRKIKTTTIHAIIFEQKHPKDNDTSLFQIFERINTSGRTLLPQEIRNCVYQWPLNSLLFELNKNPSRRTLFWNSWEDSRMRDLEYILRFFALNTDSIRNNPKSNISLKKYLNEFMGSKKNNSEEMIHNFVKDFIQAINLIKNNIWDNSFYNVQSTDLTTIRKRFYPTIYDAIMIATSIAIRSGADTSIANEQKRMELLRDQQFRKYISEGTMQIEHINWRINLALKYLYNIEND